MLKTFGLVETSASFIRVGGKFGRLTIVAVGKVPNTYRYMAICKCECGSAAKAIRADGLTNGRVLSCGCIQRERSTKHGLHSSPHYGRWRNMMDRCYNPKCKAYPDYGGRGIKVCDAWHDLTAFIDGLPDGFFPGAEMDRIDNDGDYRPGNIQWVERSPNTDNRRSGRRIEFRGKSQSLRRWSEELGLDERLLHLRVTRYGWSIERAFTTSPMGAKARMAKAHETRWAGHKKKPKPKPKPMVVRRFKFRGRDLTLAEISKKTGIDARLLRKRICERGWTVERATSE